MPATNPHVWSFLTAIFTERQWADDQLADFLHPERFPDWPARYRVQMQYRGFRRARLSELVSNASVDQREEIERVGKHARPVLVIWGKQDPQVPIESSAALLEAMPRGSSGDGRRRGPPAAVGTAGDRQRRHRGIPARGERVARIMTPARGGRASIVFVLAAALALHPTGAAAQAAEAAELRWAGDAEGGAPFVEADPANPEQVVGFDVEIAALIARGVGRVPRFVMITYTSIDQSIARGDADIGLSGIEDTPARRATLAVTVPYYEFREVLTVRTEDAGRLRTLADLRGKRVGTLGGTIAYEILLRAEDQHGLSAVSYEDDVHPYSDLLLGRIDAVLLDHVLAERRQRTMAGITTQPQTVAVGHYVGVLAATDAALRDTIDDVLRNAMRDGSLERIFRKWNVWNDDQPKLYAKLLAGEPVSSAVE